MAIVYIFLFGVGSFVGGLFAPTWALIFLISGTGALIASGTAREALLL